MLLGKVPFISCRSEWHSPASQVRINTSSASGSPSVSCSISSSPGGVEHRCPDGVGHVVYLSHRERAEPVSGDSPKIKRRQGPRIGDLMKVSISPACGITVGYLRIVSAGRIGATSALYLVCGESNVGATQRW